MNDVGRGMPSLQLGNIDGRTISGVACHHRPWRAHMVGRRQAWHDITAFVQHTRSNDVGRGMPSTPRDNTHGRTTSGVSCYHRLWAAQTVRRRRACHAITALGQHTWSDDVGRGIQSPPMDSNTVGLRRACHDITTFGQHTRLNDVGRGMPSSPLGSTHGRTT